MGDHKTAPKFQGPYIIIDKAPHNVYKLQHLHTGKILQSHVHVDKLKSCASAREMCYQKMPRQDADSSGTDDTPGNDSPEYGGGGDAGEAYSGGQTPTARAAADRPADAPQPPERPG